MVLTSDGTVIGTRNVTVAPAPISASHSLLPSPPDHSVITAGQATAIRVLPRDAYSNAAALTATQRLVAVVQYVARWPQAAWAPAVANVTRIDLAAEAGGGAYAPWAGSWVAQAAGEAVVSVLLEERLVEGVFVELQMVAASVRSSFQLQFDIIHATLYFQSCIVHPIPPLLVERL